MTTTTDRSLASAPSPYWQWLKEAEPLPDPLHWCHSTDAYSLRSMLRQGAISRSHCDVFGDDLIYLFYGRPAYRRAEAEQLRLSAKSPIVIVLSPEVEALGKRLFPFDSGAYKDRYVDLRHQKMPLNDFELPCGSFAPQRHVGQFFENNANYIMMQPRRPPKNYDGEFEVEAVAHIVHESSTRSADDRRLAVELQVPVDIPLRLPYVTALVVPDLLLAAPWFLDWQSANVEVAIRTYEFIPLYTAGHYRDSLERAVRELSTSKRGDVL